MADKDFKKLQRFVESALTNPRHPVYQLGLHQSPILQHYAINVSMLGAIEPKAWFEQYPQYAEKLEQVMAECEAVESAESAVAETPERVKALEAENRKLAGRLAALEAKLAENQTAPAAADETAEDEAGADQSGGEEDEDEDEQPFDDDGEDETAEA